MQPSIVLPIHDPGGLIAPFLNRITPDLKNIFQRAFVSLSPSTQQRQPEFIERLLADPFFAINYNAPNSLPGDHYLAGYRYAVSNTTAESLLHLCDIDRVAYALLSDYREPFLASLMEAENIQNALVFERSPSAWSTYPDNYREIEGMVMRVGQMLYGRYLDFGWSYLVIRAGLLQALIPRIQSHDFSLLIEMVLLLEGRLQTKEVDWLAWEDPFIFGRDARSLREERENSREETVKRLRGLLPFFQQFLRLSPELNTTLRWDKELITRG